MAFNYYSGADFRKSNELLLSNLKQSFEAVQIGDTQVRVELANIDNDPAKGQDTNREALALQRATAIKNDPDTLMVVTQLESQSLRSILPLFLELASPPIPVIATRETDDLWSDCKKPPAHSWCDQKFAPVLQLPARNTEEAESAVRFAIQHFAARQDHSVTHCLVVKNDQSDNSQNVDYVDDLAAQFTGNLEKYYRNPEMGAEIGEPGEPVGLSEVTQQKALGDFNCVLYAGDLQGARKLLQFTTERKSPKAKPSPLLILSDDSVLPIIHGEEIQTYATQQLNPDVYFMDFLDGNDWNSQVNPYVNTAFEIAKQLVQHLNARGNWWFRLRRDFRSPSAQVVRKYLVDVLQRNDELRVSYDGWTDSRYPDEHPTYTFRQGRSVGTIYHVWQPRMPIGKLVKMNDVDYWHRPKQSAANQ